MGVDVLTDVGLAFRASSNCRVRLTRRTAPASEAEAGAGVCARGRAYRAVKLVVAEPRTTPFLSATAVTWYVPACRGRK